MTLSEFRDNPAWVTIMLKNGLTYRVPVLMPYLDNFLDGLNRGSESPIHARCHPRTSRTQIRPNVIS